MGILATQAVFEGFKKTIKICFAPGSCLCAFILFSCDWKRKTKFKHPKIFPKFACEIFHDEADFRFFGSPLVVLTRHWCRHEEL